MSDKEDESTIYLEIKALFGIDNDEGLRWVQFSEKPEGRFFSQVQMDKKRLELRKLKSMSVN